MGIAAAIAASGARVVLVMNLITAPGETDRLTAQDDLPALRAHAPILPVHDVILNDTRVPEPRRRYADAGVGAVAADAAVLRRLACTIWTGDLLAARDSVRNDSYKLSRAVLELAGRPWLARPRI